MDCTGHQQLVLILFGIPNSTASLSTFFLHFSTIIDSSSGSGPLAYNERYFNQFLFGSDVNFAAFLMASNIWCSMQNVADFIVHIDFKLRVGANDLNTNKI